MNIKERVTQSVLHSATPNVTRINDTQYIGFHVRLGKIKPDGSRLASYYYFYRLGGRNGRQVNYFIGNSDSMDAGIARRIAAQIEPHVRDGKDIVKMKFNAEKSDVRLKDFWRFLGREFVKKRYKNSDDAIRNIETNVLPQIGSVNLDKLSHKLVELRVVKPMLANGITSQLNVVLSQFRVLLQHAVDNEYLVNQPIGRFDLPKVIDDNKLIAGDPLSGSQIKGVYYRAANTSKNAVYLFTLRLQILTGLPLSIILASYRQDIKGNAWLLRATNGKLSGKVIPLSGPLKLLIKEVIANFSTPHSLYMFPSKGKRQLNDLGMDVRAVAKGQQRFIEQVHGKRMSMTSLLRDIERAMIDVGVEPLVVAYLFDQKVADYLQLNARDQAIDRGLSRWYRG